MVLKGELILKEEPFVYVLKSTFRNEKCEFCFARAELKCSRCQYWHYCNRRCQKLAWSMHKLECDYLRTILPKTIPDSAHMLIRILLKLKNTNLKNDEKKRPFADLMSHITEIRNDRRRMEHFTSLAFVIKSIFGDSEELNEEYLLELFGKLCINSFNILDNDMNSVGTGIYLNASVIDHSCCPNATTVFDGCTLYVRSVEDIQNFHLNKVRISYIDLLNSSSERRKELQKMYYFFCDCQNCVNKTNEDVMHSIKCSNDNCSGFISMNEKEDGKPLCNACHEEVSEEKLKEYVEVIQLSDHHLQNMTSSESAYIDVCQIILSKQEKILSDLNLRRVKMLDFAFNACINLERWSEAIIYGSQLLPGFRKYHGVYHPLVGLLYLQLLKLILLQNDQEKAAEYYGEAAKILSVTHGSSHPFSKTLKEIMYS